MDAETLLACLEAMTEEQKERLLDFLEDLFTEHEDFLDDDNLEVPADNDAEDSSDAE